jgi:uncharacterized sporulation protein YeaH/YhbH (DUF444 family)
MKVKAVTKYKYNGKEYNSLKDIQNDIHNTIGENVIDKINKSIEIRHKDLLKLLEIFCSVEVRETFLNCLNVTFTKEDEDGEEVTINVLDLK